ncbi:Ig-like domain repeat protein [Streptomyces phaeolivaceus]|uniref:Ig-like domain repeat protein n=1 Tax=Streptomyces phaeolivaceus TaxID=2653200 RepID=A0A5P8K716_9ACTN|nr:Ig-like domain repeat protein [Streptomyces phaeolivaceus]QFQ98844.1 Ig-like domain repeat protein [Streptomyces phaeolivaceus]
MRTLPAATALAVLFSSAALAVGTVAPAAADSSRSIAVSDPSDTVVDAGHQRLFISDPGNSKIVVTTYAGVVVTQLTGLPQVRDLELSPDGTTLYAAVSGADKIVAIDTETRTQTAEYPTGANTDPSRLALAGGKLWFAYGDQWDSGLGAVDLTAETPTVTLDLSGGHDYASPPRLYADPDNPGTLVALDAGISSGPVIVYDVSSGTPVIRVSADKGGFPNDAALTPDGTHLVVAGNNSRALTEYRLSDLEQTRTFPVADEPMGVDIAPDGTVAATIFDFDDAGDTYVFTKGADQPASVRDLHPSVLWNDNGVVWAPDGQKLFALTSSSGATTFHVVDEPRKYTNRITVSAPATATRAKALTVKGTLTSNLALPAGTPLTVTRTDMESPKGKSLGTKSLGADGKFSFQDTPPSGGKVTYKVTYAGDAEHTAASASTKVEVSRAGAALSLDKNRKTYAYGADVKFTAHLGKTYKNRKVEIWADPYGPDRPNKLVKSGTVNSKGDLSATVDLKRDTKISVKFAGDSRYRARTVTNTVYTKVAISSSISGHYKTRTVWGQKYHYVRKSKDPVLKTSMTYYKDRKQRLQLQFHYDGAWHDAGSEYFPLGTSGKSHVTLTGTPTTDIRFRFRSEYHDTTSGDNVNTTTYGAWKYFIFTK